MWPFRKRSPEPNAEQRNAPYSDAIISQILANAESETPDVQVVAALETAAGIVARAFALANVAGAAVPAHTLAHVGRMLITSGEAILYRNGNILYPVSNCDVHGGFARSEWMYAIELVSPGGAVRHVTVPPRQIVHVQYSYDSRRPWEGVSPLRRAIVSGELAARIEAVLNSEMKGQVGYLLPIPTDASDVSITQLKADLQSLKGKTALVETTAMGWGEGRSSAPRSDYVPQRIGADPPASVLQIWTAVQQAVLGVCGIPAEIVLQSLEGTGQREAWRRCLHSTIQPLGRLAGEALSVAYGREVTLSFESLFASDIQGRARAFQSLVGGGMPLEKAAAVSGLLMEDEM